MKKEASLEIINKEIVRWERIRDLVTTLEKGKMYKIVFNYTERKETIPGDWKSAIWIPRESVFIGTLKEYNKQSINMEVHSIDDVEKSEFRYKIAEHARGITSYRRQLKELEGNYALPGVTTMSDQDAKDKKRYIKNLNKKFHCSIKLDAFKSWEEWEPNVLEAPLMINNDFISEKMKQLLFGV